MGLTLVTPPSEWPVTIEEARAQCRIINSDSDARLTGFIKAATAHVETALGVSLTERTYRLTLDSFSDAIELPRGPVTAVTQVGYVDTDGEAQTVPTADYTVDLVSSSPWVVRNSDASWPTTLNAVNAVTVEYTAGYEVVPEDIKAAILLTIQHWNDVSQLEDATKAAIPPWFDALLQPHRRVLV
jgi:uncharacterized phiE125 gp8 family phage protein